MAATKEAQIQDKKSMKNDLKARISELEAQLSNGDELVLPIEMDLNAVRISKINGREFDGLEDFIKQQVVDTFATSTKIRDDLDLKLRKKLENMLNKKISLAVVEVDRESNTYVIYRMSDIILKVAGLEICIWTVD